jgi:hypothetical protein
LSSASLFCCYLHHVGSAQAVAHVYGNVGIHTIKLVKCTKTYLN